MVVLAQSAWRSEDLGDSEERGELCYNSTMNTAPLRIGIFTDDFYPNSGGVARSIELQISELHALGHDVVLFAPRPFLSRRLVSNQKCWTRGISTAHLAFSVLSSLVMHWLKTL